jgi:hypothetical protein
MKDTIFQAFNSDKHTQTYTAHINVGLLEAVCSANQPCRVGG